MKQLILKIVCASMIVSFCVGYTYLYVKDNERTQGQEVADIEYFKQGQILLPDACSDTLVVINASGLNSAMALIEQGFTESSDFSLDSTFHCYCSILNGNLTAKK